MSAAKCPPGLLALRDGVVSFTTATSVEIQTPARRITGSLSGWGSLILRVDDTKYVLVANVGQLSNPFTKTQQQAMDAAERSSSLRTITDWPEILNAAGARISSARFPYRRLVLGITITVAASAAIIGLVVSSS
jgi:hypothetical protein